MARKVYPEDLIKGMEEDYRLPVTYETNKTTDMFKDPRPEIVSGNPENVFSVHFGFFPEKTEGWDHLYMSTHTYTWDEKPHLSMSLMFGGKRPEGSFHGHGFAMNFETLETFRSINSEFAHLSWEAIDESVSVTLPSDVVAAVGIGYNLIYEKVAQVRNVEPEKGFEIYRQDYRWEIRGVSWKQRSCFNELPFPMPRLYYTIKD